VLIGLVGVGLIYGAVAVSGAAHRHGNPELASRASWRRVIGLGLTTLRAGIHPMVNQA
jgi:hypothetical protein